LSELLFGGMVLSKMVSRKELLEEFLEVVLQDDSGPELVSFERFVKEILGYELEWFHKEWFERQLAHKRTLILAPRGHGKSTICTIAYSLYRLLSHPDLRVLIVSNTAVQARAFLREIRAHLEANFWFQAHFGNLRVKPWNDLELSISTRSKKKKEASITALGVLGPIIARHYDLIILDDVVDEENARSQKLRDKLLVWYYKVLLPALEPEGEIHIIGTRYHYLDLYGHLLEQEFREHHWVYCAIQEVKGRELALWEEKFSLKLLKEKQKEAGSIIFNSQYQNDVQLMRGAIFKKEWFQYYQVLPGAVRLEKFIGIDLALSQKESGDYFALVVCGRERRSGKVYVLDCIHTRLTFSKQLELTVNYFKKHNEPKAPVIRVCVEANAYQEAFAQKLREKGLPVKSIIRVKDKLSRAYQVQARFENGEILFPSRGAEDLIEELLLFPESEHDDLFDAMEITISQIKTLSYARYLKPVFNVEPE